MTELSLVDQIDSGINQEWLDLWIEDRKYRKVPMTPLAIKILTTKLLQWSIPEQERLIRHAIESRWKTVYWVDAPKPQSTRQTSLEQDLTNTDWAN